MQGSLHAAHTIGRRRRGAERCQPVPVPRPRQRRHHRAFPRHLQLAGHPPERVPGLGRVGVRAPRVPQRLRQPLHHLVRWMRWMAGKNRVERTFSVGHTGGDLSAPEAVREQIMPSPFPGEGHASHTPIRPDFSAMQVFTTSALEDPRDVRTLYPRLEEIGYDGVFSFEAKHDPFVALAVAAEHTTACSSAPRSRSRSRATRCRWPTSATTSSSSPAGGSCSGSVRRCGRTS